MKRISRRACGVLALASLCAIPLAASAQATYPSKPIRIVLGVAPGGLIDVTARLMGSYLSTRLGQQIIIENKPGASTTLGANAVLKAAPDGYTLFYGGVMSASPIFVKNGAVDFATQMKPVSQLLSAPFYLLVSSKVPVKTMQELVAYSKQNPGKLNFADGAPLSTMVMHALAERTGLSYTPIPYKGSAPSLNALVAGEVELTLDTVPNYLQHIRAGKVRAVMSTGSSRIPALPDVPAGKEVKGFDLNTASVLSFWAPPGTPDAIVQRLNTEIAAIARNPEFREKFQAATQVDPTVSSPTELLKAIEVDKALYGQMAKQMGYEPQ
jgi:tripartite-type tricarboxylate transporter receptor subunit TctC